ncbi:MAG TPA: hypothetical protein PK129_18515, partial [Cellvibrionaceae bacterium]|nr:hypothetical protein [Cellvibrionaceae bacterium]
VIYHVDLALDKLSGGAVSQQANPTDHSHHGASITKLNCSPSYRAPKEILGNSSQTQLLVLL